MIDTDVTLLPICIKSDLARLQGLITSPRPCLPSDSRQGWMCECTFCQAPPTRVCQTPNHSSQSLKQRSSHVLQSYAATFHVEMSM